MSDQNTRVFALGMQELTDIAECFELLSTAKEGDKVPESMAILIDLLQHFKDAGGADDDGQKKSLSEDLAKARLLYRQSQRAYFREQYAPEINSRPKEFWAFPYTDVSFSILAYEQARFGSITDQEATELVPIDTWADFKVAHARVEKDFERVFSVIAAGGLTDDDGNAVVEVKDGEIDLTPIVRTLQSKGFDSMDFFNDSLFEESSYWILKPATWRMQNTSGEVEEIEGYSIVCEEIERDEEGNESVSGVELAFDLDYFGFRYLFLYAVSSLMGCENAVRELTKPPKRPRKSKNLKMGKALMPNDAVTNALFGRDENEIPASEYHCGKEKSIEVKTGKDTSISLTIVNGMEFDAAMEAYKLSPEDRFWLEAVISVAWNDGKEPVREIRGTDLLKFNGYKNPYQTTARPTLLKAAESIFKMSRVIQVAIDTTNERRKYRGVVESYLLQPVIDGNLELIRFEDDTVDFAIRLNRTNGDGAFDALPLAKYSSDKKQLICAERDDLEFKNLRLTDEHRMMWRYVLRRIRQKGTSNTIVFETMFRNIGLENVDRQKRSRMLTMLHKMLEQRRDEGVLAFEWNRDKKGKKEYSVTITEAKNAINPDAERY